MNDGAFVVGSAEALDPPRSRGSGGTAVRRRSRDEPGLPVPPRPPHTRPGPKGAGGTRLWERGERPSAPLTPAAQPMTSTVCHAPSAPTRSEGGAAAQRSDLTDFSFTESRSGARATVGLFFSPASDLLTEPSLQGRTLLTGLWSLQGRTLVTDPPSVLCLWFLLFLLRLLLEASVLPF